MYNNLLRFVAQAATRLRSNHSFDADAKATWPPLVLLRSDTICFLLLLASETKLEQSQLDS